MKVALIGSRWFGAETLKILLDRGHEVSVLGLTEDNSLSKAAMAAGLPLLVLGSARRVTADDIPEPVDLIVTAHAHSFIGAGARGRATRAAIGYHPSLLPRHRGIAAVEWTIKSGDPIAGGSIYHLADTLDGGALAAQDWCFVYPDDDAGTLWRRALGPMGLRLMREVIDEIDVTGTCKALPQDPKAVTLAPAFDGAH